MNSIILVVMGMLLLTAELIPAAPSPFLDTNDDLVLPEQDFNDLELVKRSSFVKQRKCLLSCLACTRNTNMEMMDCASGCSDSGASTGQSRAYAACYNYLHSGRK